MIMNDGMTSRRVMRACFAIAALVLLACAQGCGESARPVATRVASSASAGAARASPHRATPECPY